MPETNVNALLSGRYWSSNILGYFFADTLSDYQYRDPSFVYGFQPVGSSHQQAVHNILKGNAPSAPNGPTYMTLSSVEAVSNMYLYSTGNSPETIAIGQSTLLSRSTSYYPDPTWRDIRTGDVWLSKDITNASLESFGYHTIMHELGHAFGLKHGHEQGDTSNPVVLTPDRDSIEFSVMTYRTYLGDQDLNNFGALDTPQTFMMYDIAALQYMYGANFNTNNTNTVYSWSESGSAYVNGVEAGKGFNIFLTIWDGGGIDTYDFSNFTDEMTIDLTPGSWSKFSQADLAYLGDDHLAHGNVFNALQYQGDSRSLIENAIGGDLSDAITGNAADNHLFGHYGNDTLYGSFGADTLEGGGENDWMDGGADGDLLLGGDGWDTVAYLSAVSGVIVDLATNQNGGEAYGDVLVDVESVRGSTYDDRLVASSQGSHLYGEIGNDNLIGRSSSDVLSGGGGNDTLDGGGGDDSLWGDNSNDVIMGNAGNDFIQGGAGADTMDGGSDIDTLVYDGPEGALVDLRTSFVAGQAEGDVIGGFENVVGGAGNDTLYGSADANELNGQDGNDILAGADGADTLWGAGGHDWLEGGTGNDLLAGGAGDDRLVGGTGNDALHGEAGRDTFVFETALNAASNVDWIADFTVAEDWIGLSRSVFGGFGASVSLVIGTAATADNAAQVVYDDITGALYYDADGASPAAQVQFAQLASRLSLTAANFVLL